MKTRVALTEKQVNYILPLKCMNFSIQVVVSMMSVNMITSALTSAMMRLSVVSRCPSSTLTLVTGILEKSMKVRIVKSVQLSVLIIQRSYLMVMVCRILWMIHHSRNMKVIHNLLGKPSFRKKNV